MSNVHPDDVAAAREFMSGVGNVYEFNSAIGQLRPEVVSEMQRSGEYDSRRRLARATGSEPMQSTVR